MAVFMSAHNFLHSMSLDNLGSKDLDLDFVKRYLAVRTFALTDIHLKTFSMMGDRLAGCILKLLYPMGVVDDVRLAKILAAVSRRIRVSGND